MKPKVTRRTPNRRQIQTTNKRRLEKGDGNRGLGNASRAAVLNTFSWKVCIIRTRACCYNSGDNVVAAAYERSCACRGKVCVARDRQYHCCCCFSIPRQGDPGCHPVDVRKRAHQNAIDRENGFETIKCLKWCGGHVHSRLCHMQFEVGRQTSCATRYWDLLLSNDESATRAVMAPAGSGTKILWTGNIEIS